MEIKQSLYLTNQTLVVKKTNSKVKVIDIEIFENLILYYTDDKKAYPEFELDFVPEYVEFVNFWDRTDDDWKKITNDFMKSHGLV